MAKDTRFRDKKEQKISAVLPTNEGLTGRVGMALFEAYVRSIQILPLIDRWFGSMRKSSKGLAITELFVQLFCFFMDGTSRHITWFDHLKADESYAGVIGSSNLASSHTIKRLFSKFSYVRGFLFRRLLQHLFIWRLKITKPEVIVLGMDTMVLDNDDALKRHGVQPTYKKVKGFHPLQLNWGRYFVDAVFRGGKKHSNHGDTADSMLVYVVEKIRKEYRADVPILVRMDAGFFDHELFEIMEYLHVGYYCGGKRYNNVRNAATLATDWLTFSSKDKREIWEYTEFKTRQGGWHKTRRTIYSRLIQKGRQLALPGLVRDSVIITNLGMAGHVDELIRQAGQGHLLTAHTILAGYHQRGADDAKLDARAQDVKKEQKQVAEAFLLKAQLLQLTFAFEEDAKNFEKAVTISPDWDTHFTTANFYALLNEFKKAEVLYKKALLLAGKLHERAMTLIYFGIFYHEAVPDQHQSLACITEVLHIILPLIERLPFAKKYAEAAFQVVVAWGINPEEFIRQL